MPIGGIVADANVLLSAVAGNAALRVLTEFNVPVFVTSFNAEEVARYLPRMAAKYNLPIDLLQLQWKLLPLRLHPFEDYADHFEEAFRDLKGRDRDDAHPLALARTLDLPLWSNDRDLQNLGVECFPTARLLKILSDDRAR
ncbi:MAG TPA: PIN domain-containing protein [Thermoanaerobaculia bacterium]|nr:PIN domain-containing protein [Thermoanaerobaculia bacterium]